MIIISYTLIDNMRYISALAIALLTLTLAQAASIYDCIDSAFNNTCKTKLYACTNNP